MRLNKIILPIALITPLFASSCDKGGKYKDVTLDAYEMVYAFSQTCSTTITISDGLSDVEFVDDFKKEYFTFDNINDIQGKSYEINKKSSKSISVDFTGAYNGLGLIKDQTKEIKYKISKSAFKNNVLTADATGKMHMKWDSVHCNGREQGETALNLECKFTSTDSSAPTTRVTVNPSMETTEQNLSNYCSNAPVGSKISFSYEKKESCDYLKINISGLPDDGEHGYPINVTNKPGETVFNNLPDGYGLSFKIKNEGASTEYDVEDDNFYFDKATSSQITVIFDTDGGSAIAPVTISTGGKVSRPASDPTKTDYVFDDWYTTANEKTKFDFDNTTINTNTTIYAHFLKEITFVRAYQESAYHYQYTQAGTITKGTKYRLIIERTSNDTNITYLAACNENWSQGYIYYDINTIESKLICVTKVSKYDSGTGTTTPLVENTGFEIIHSTDYNFDYISFSGKTTFNLNDKVIVDCIVTNDITDNGVWFYAS